MKEKKRDERIQEKRSKHVATRWWERQRRKRGRLVGRRHQRRRWAPGTARNGVCTPSTPARPLLHVCRQRRRLPALRRRQQLRRGPPLDRREPVCWDGWFLCRNTRMSTQTTAMADRAATTRPGGRRTTSTSAADVCGQRSISRLCCDGSEFPCCPSR